MFVASPELDKAFVEELTAAILENQDVILSSILETGENDKYLEGQFVDADDADYDSMREAYRVLGMELD
ncbi:hypothetical protein JCM19046_837 [Bacillus sp. JCM 19046]|nr:hypothetical protein JCM19046_837 [Bacillus sp. JCM 19046]